MQVDKGEDGYEEFSGRSMIICTLNETEKAYKMSTGCMGDMPDIVMMLETIISDVIDDTPMAVKTPLAMMLLTGILDKCPEVLVTEEMHTLVKKIMEERERIGIWKDE